MAVIKSPLGSESLLKRVDEPDNVKEAVPPSSTFILSLKVNGGRPIVKVTTSDGKETPPHELL